MRKLCAIAGILALLSMTFYGFTGMSLWAAVDGADGRAAVLVLLHFCGLVAGLIACIGDFW